MTAYDVIVLGAGATGSAAMLHAAKRGVRVLGLDRFPAGHDQGSSHGQTRVIRQAYFEHVDYVPLLLDAYRLWSELEQETGQRLFYQVGLLEIGPADGEVAPGVLQADALHDLGVETVTHAEAGKRFPAFGFPEDYLAVFEPQAGYLLVERAVVAHIDAAVQAGAEHRSGVDIRGWRADDGGYVVETSEGEFSATRLIITAGAWAGSLLADLGVPLKVLRKHLHWLPAATDYWNPESPTYLLETPEGVFYGFPPIDSLGLKVAEHSGGEAIVDPRTDDRAEDPEDNRRVDQFVARYLRGVESKRNHHDVCYYTTTPDLHFVVDRHPDHAGVVFAAGLSGHGFKFAPVLGASLVELALDGRTDRPVAFLGLDRPALRP